jgi:hypothetical protein
MTWWSASCFYEIYIRSFQDSNDDGVGDLNGITTRLPYLHCGHEQRGHSRGGTFSANGRKFGRFWDVAWFERPLMLLGGAPPTFLA